jgi:putative endonuclease
VGGDDTDFRGQPHRRAKGKVGEEAAERWLVANGYVIVERNVHLRGGEIDVIAQDGETLCFIEVKARSNDLYGAALTAVPAAKQRRLARAAAAYLLRHRWSGPCRFDVLGLDLEAQGTWRISLVRDAFSLPLGSYGHF